MTRDRQEIIGALTLIAFNLASLKKKAIIRGRSIIKVISSIGFSLTLALSLFTPSVLFADDGKANKAECYNTIDKSVPTDAETIYNMGTVSLRSKNYDRALVCLKKAYEIGNDEVKSSAATNLGYYYTEDKVKNVQEAIKWHKIAIEIDNSPVSMCSLGIIYKEEFKDYPKAIEWFEKAYKAKDKEAAYRLGLLYKRELKDYPNAIKWYEISHNQKDKNAAHALGLLYKDALKDYPNALKWFQISFDKNEHYGSLYWIGIMYKEGLGVKQDLIKARAVFQQCVDESDGEVEQYAKDELAKLDKLDRLDLNKSK